MNKAIKSFAMFLMLLTAACGMMPAPEPSATKAASHYIYVDVSASTGLIENPEYAARVLDELTARIKSAHLGDTIQIIVVGGRNPDNAIKRPIKLGYQLRQKAAAQKVRQMVGTIIEENRAKGGEDTTNLLWAFERSAMQCASPDDTVLAITDGLEVSSSYSTPLALATGKAVELPAPDTPYLRNCRLEFWGLGILSGGESLDVIQMNALENGWRTYGKLAGVNIEQNLSFRSII